MTLEAALTERLAQANIAPGAFERVDWGRNIRALPALTLMVTFDARPQHFRGFQRVRSTAMQADIWSASHAEAVSLREQLIAVLATAGTFGGVRFQRAMIEAVRGGVEQQQTSQPAQRLRGEIHRQSIDFILTHDAN